MRKLYIMNVFLGATLVTLLVFQSSHAFAGTSPFRSAHSAIKRVVKRITGKKQPKNSQTVSKAPSTARDLKGGPVHTRGGVAVEKGHERQPGLHPDEIRAMEKARPAKASGPVHTRSGRAVTRGKEQQPGEPALAPKAPAQAGKTPPPVPPRSPPAGKGSPSAPPVPPRQNPGN